MAHPRGGSDFEVEDVWLLRTPGGADEFPRLVAQLVADSWPDGAPLIVRFLRAARWRLGALLGWDGERSGVGSRVSSLRDRLPEDLRAAPSGPKFEPFVSVYQPPAEWAAELANRTVHAVMHLGWVPDGSGGYRGQMAVLVRPDGLAVVPTWARSSRSGTSSSTRCWCAGSSASGR